jgi:type III secretory pathway component EscS
MIPVFATITLSHFSAALIFAFFASVVFGITQRNTQKEMLLYGLKCFALFLGLTIAAGWLMWLLRH